MGKRAQLILLLVLPIAALRMNIDVAAVRAAAALQLRDPATGATSASGGERAGAQAPRAA